MPKFNVLITEKLAGTLEIEATNSSQAILTAMSMIEKNEVPSDIMDETDGYKIEDVQQKDEEGQDMD